MIAEFVALPSVPLRAQLGCGTVRHPFWGGFTVLEQAAGITDPPSDQCVSNSNKTWFQESGRRKIDAFCPLSSPLMLLCKWHEPKHFFFVRFLVLGTTHSENVGWRGWDPGRWMTVCELLVTKTHPDSGLSSYFCLCTIFKGGLLAFFIYLS